MTASHHEQCGHRRSNPSGVGTATIGDVTEPRFCDQCGRSLVPLSTPHVSRACSECGKQVFLAEPGEGGKGIRVSRGDTFRIPAGWLQLSLDPAKSTGRFLRPGVAWFATNLLAGDLPGDTSELVSYLERLKERADQVLEGSDRLSHLDLEDEAEAQQAIELLEKARDTPEWWALMIGTFASEIIDHINGEVTDRTVLYSVRMQAAHSMLVFKESLEDHVWTGYTHTSLIYNIASASARTPEDAERIEAVRPLFLKLPEDVLHAWVEAGVNIGERIGVKDIDDDLLMGLAKFHLSLLDRRRHEAEMARDRSTRVWANRIAAAAVGATITGALIALLH